jgi:hypothetical protein
MTRFWSSWLLVWCWGVLAFGALLVTAGMPGLDAAARTLFVIFSGDPANTQTFDLPAVRFGLGLQGALTIGWAMTMLAMRKAAATLGAPAWRALTAALVVWYVLDSAISISTGFWLNAVSNTALMIAYLIPVLASSAMK